MSATMCWAVSAFLVTFASGAGAWPGCEQDDIHATVDGGVLTVHHEDAVYNCCLDDVTYSVSQGEGLIQIVETEVLTNPCVCLCCYDLSADVEDLAPGEYTLILTWHDYDTGTWEEWSSPVMIGGTPGGGPFVAEARNSGCLDPSSAPDRPDGLDNWGRVKSLYR